TRFQRDALSVVTEDVSELPSIDQQIFEASHNEKLGLLIALLSDRQPSSCVVFCNTKREWDDVAAALNARDISALPL
ncbi:ATP-dependent RNA helicase DbpA, partial [Pantoea agglomerans]